MYLIGFLAGVLKINYLTATEYRHGVSSRVLCQQAFHPQEGARSTDSTKRHELARERVHASRGAVKHRDGTIDGIEVVSVPYTLQW